MVMGGEDEEDEEEGEGMGVTFLPMLYCIHPSTVDSPAEITEIGV